MNNKKVNFKKRVNLVDMGKSLPLVQLGDPSTRVGGDLIPGKGSFMSKNRK
jgi:hypothetical protein